MARAETAPDRRRIERRSRWLVPARCAWWVSAWGWGSGWAWGWAWGWRSSGGCRLREVGRHATRAVQAGLADLVVRRALLLAAQHLVRLRHFLEVLLRRPRVARVLVGVVLDRELLVRRLDLRVRRAAWHAEHLVVVVAIQLLLRHLCVETRRARVGTSRVRSRPFEVRTVNAMCQGERQPHEFARTATGTLGTWLGHPRGTEGCNGAKFWPDANTIAIRAELARKRCVLGG